MQTRKNPRLSGYDYSREGVYFVTICTAGRQRLLGTVHTAPTLDLPKLVRSFKGLCTKAAGHPIWQRGYYDHIIRDENDFLRCWKYLDENPVSWQERHPAEDPEPENRQGGRP